jgi:hypothetical protein
MATIPDDEQQPLGADPVPSAAPPVTLGDFIVARLQVGPVLALDLTAAADGRVGLLYGRAYHPATADPAFRAELDRATYECWRAHPAKRPTAAEVALSLYAPIPRFWTRDALTEKHSARKALARALRDVLHTTWRAYLAALPPP